MEFISSCIKFYCQKFIIVVSVALLIACGDQQNGADKVFPMHAIASVNQLVALDTSSPTLGPRANYTITKKSTGYSVTDVVGAAGTQTFSLTTTQIVFSDLTVNLRIGDKSQTISPSNLQSLIELYIAYFKRVPDADGLSYWIDQLLAGQSIDQIGALFYNAAIQYSSLTGYSSSMSNLEFITLIYKNVLGRTTVDSSGMNYWLKGLENGSQTRGTLVRTILGAAHAFKGDPTYGYVADLLDNKVKFANSFTIQQGLNYNTPQDSITNTMAMVAVITPSSTANASAMLPNLDWDFLEVTNPPFPTIIVAKTVFATSYQNRHSINFEETQIPSVRRLKEDGFITGTDESIVNDRSVAFADFFQDGSYSAFISVWRATNRFPDLGFTPQVDSPNKIYFLKKINGQWKDQTATLLPNASDRYSCVSHSYTQIADFNNDSKPDLFISCHGIDFNYPNIFTLYPTTWRDILFEEQIVLLSQADGTYKRTTIPGKIYGHHATIGDINGDGKPDVITVNASFGNTDGTPDYTPFFLIGKGDGTFIRDYSRLPANMVQDIASNIHIYWTYLIPTDGRLDLVVVGDKIAWYKNPGNGNFSNVTPTYIPLTVGYAASPLDIAYSNGYFYVNHSGGDWPGTMRIKKVSVIDMSVTEIYSTGVPSEAGEGAISPNFKITSDKRYIVPYVAGCERETSDPSFNQSKCSIKISL